MYDYANRIKELRVSYNISARKLALAINITPSQISIIENGKSYPSVQLLDSLCDFFKISHSEFFNNYNTLHSAKPAFTTYSKKTQKLIELYDNATKEDKAVINLLLSKYEKQK